MTSKQATQNMITRQLLYKWDSEESQVTYLNLYPKLEEISKTKEFCSAILFQLQNLEIKYIAK